MTFTLNSWLNSLRAIAPTRTPSRLFAEWRNVLTRIITVAGLILVVVHATALFAQSTSTDPVFHDKAKVVGLPFPSVLSELRVTAAPNLSFSAEVNQAIMIRQNNGSVSRSERRSFIARDNSGNLFEADGYDESTQLYQSLYVAYKDAGVLKLCSIAKTTCLSRIAIQREQADSSVKEPGRSTPNENFVELESRQLFGGTGKHRQTYPRNRIGALTKEASEPVLDYWMLPGLQVCSSMLHSMKAGAVQATTSITKLNRGAPDLSVFSQISDMQEKPLVPPTN
jgi:hypothetical protein